MTKTSKGMIFPVGQTCQVEFGKVKYLSTFRGMIDEDYFFMDIPALRGKPMLAPPETVLVVRFIHDGQVYGFESSLYKTFTKPVMLWAARYPAKIDNVKLRKSERISTFFPAQLKINGAASTGAVVDISAEGAMFSTESADVGNGARVSLEFALPSGDMITGFGCSVCNIKKGDKAVNIGLKFEDTGGASYQAIREFYDICIMAMI